LNRIPSNTFGYDWSLKWNDKGEPIHTPVVYNTTLVLNTVCFPDMAALEDLGKEVLAKLNTNAAAGIFIHDL